MVKRRKVVLADSLKADSFEDGATAIKTAYIKEVKNVQTKFDDDDTTSTVILLEDENETDKDKKIKSVFANSTSINNLIDAFGEEDNIWIGKAVSVICNKKNFYNKKQLVIVPVK